MKQLALRRVCLAGVCAGLLASFVNASGGVFAGESVPDAKTGTWDATMRAARDALVQQERANHVERLRTFTSDVVRGSQPAQFINVPIRGVRELYLYVTGAPEVIYGAATWAQAKLVNGRGKEQLVCHMKTLQVLEGRHDIDRNLESGVSGPLRIAGREFEHGVHIYAPGKIRIKLDRDYDRFEAWIGIDDWVGNHGAVRFHVTDRAGADRLDLWTRLALDFPEDGPRREMKWERQDQILADDWEPGDWKQLAERYAAACFRVKPLAERANVLARQVRTATDYQMVRQLYLRSRVLDGARQRAVRLNQEGLRLAIEDLLNQFGADYPQGGSLLKRLDILNSSLSNALQHTRTNDINWFNRVESLVSDFHTLQREALLANPLLDFDRLLLIRRVPHGDPRRPHGRGYGVGEYIGLPRQSSKTHPNIEQPKSWDNEIAVLSPVRPEGKISTLYKSTENRLVTDIDLHWDANKLLFSMPGSNDMWHVFEMHLPDGTPRQLTPADQPDVHYYDSCYLPNGQIAFVSTAPLQGVPCNAGVIVGMMYVMNGDGTNIHQVCFEQDHSYCPTVLNDGRILYLRWDYTDTPHVWNRILFTMHPDGTSQREFYGSNSYWPNSIFYARPIPGSPTKIVGIVTGHHVGRVGELVLFDPAQGRRETDGVLQRIPGRGKVVEPLIQDKLTEHSWPKFLHPYPLSDKYFIVSCKPTPDSLWGIYLVDVFDNMVLIKEDERHVLLEPIPWRKQKTPPVIASRVQKDRDDALAYIADIYDGPGLVGVPRGTVKELRVFTYHFGYQKLAGINDRVGTDGPWEVKRVLGTVPVEPDGSALFRIPAKTPISVQPLDADGQALQLMRSWMTAMPGETLSCSGCHENHKATIMPGDRMALKRPPRKIRPWHGPPRGFSFQREVQPVLDKYCVGCHDGSPRDDDLVIPDLRGDQGVVFAYRHGDPELKRFDNTPVDQLMGKYRGIFQPSYLALRRLVRVGGLESDLHLLPPREFGACTSELIQMLRKGHHGVELDAEAWGRLITWIDLNAPCHGTWSEFTPIKGNQCERRKQLQRLYGGVVEDAEVYPAINPRPVTPVLPPPQPQPKAALAKCDHWPFDAGEARRRQAASGPTTRTLNLGDGVTLELVRIPAGQFVMGSAAGDQDERPQSVVTIDRPFWMGRYEVTNRQYAQFNPAHDSRFEHRTSWIFSEAYLGWPLNGAEQPVVRVSCNEAQAFCQWLSRRTGTRVTLPTEGQWEYSCRAGSQTEWWYGDSGTDFGKYANMADQTMRELAYEGWRPRPPDIVARDDRFDDGRLVTANVGSYAPNPWGLYDMHGNVWEWTRSAYRAYPYQNDDRNKPRAGESRSVRGGSWYDRPRRCRSAFRLNYPAWQKVYNVGFRVVVEDAPERVVTRFQTGSGSSQPLRRGRFR